MTPLQSMLKKASKRPYEVVRRNEPNGNLVLLSHGREIAIMQGSSPEWTGTARVYDMLPDQSNAQLLCHCANVLEDLVNAVRRFEDFEKKGFCQVNETGLSPREQLRAALHKAENPE